MALRVYKVYGLGSWATGSGILGSWVEGLKAEGHRVLGVSAPLIQNLGQRVLGENTSFRV